MNRIRKGDRVIVTTGKDKGKQGEVVRVLGEKVVVSNVNIVKRHTKPNTQAGQPGGVVERVGTDAPATPAEGSAEDPEEAPLPSGT